MIKNIILLIIALLFADQCLAQETLTFTLPTDSVISSRNVYKSLRVIDMRKAKTEVGRISNSPVNDNFIKIVTEMPVANMFSNYFEKISGGKKGEFDMLLILYDLNIVQPSFYEGLGYVHFSGDFYMSRNNKYALVDSVDVFAQLSGPEFPKSLVDFAAVKIFEVLNAQAAKAVTPRWATKTEADAIARREKIKAMHAIYSAQFKQGVYYTVDQFLKNEPSDTAIIFKEGYPGESKKLYNFWYKNDKGKKGERIAEKNVFAIYNDGVWYLGGQEYLKKMWYKDGEFITNIHGVGPRGYTPDQADHTAEITGAVIGGAVGAIVAHEITKNRKPREFIAETVTAGYTSRFDPATKKFFPFER